MTSTSENARTLLYFEDDAIVADAIGELFRLEGYEVQHFAAMPGRGLDDIQAACPTMPYAVLMDTRLPGLNGYDICAILRDQWLSPEVPVLFLSGYMQQEDIMRAYSVGADDYLTKPINLDELMIKIDQARSSREQRTKLDEELSSTRQLVFDAMSNSAELGELLRYHEQALLADTPQALAELTLEVVNQFGVKASLILAPPMNTYISDDHQERPLEIELLRAINQSDAQRIVSHGQRCFFNYPHFSALIRNMPIHDESRFGVLKDQFCLLFNAMDSRVKALLTELQNQRQHAHIRLVAATLGKMVLEMEETNLQLSSQFESIIANLEANVAQDVMRFNLIEEEEHVLLTHIKASVLSANSLFDEALSKEAQYQKIMKGLLGTLERESSS